MTGSSATEASFEQEFINRNKNDIRILPLRTLFIA
jgi:hypothetical protein